MTHQRPKAACDVFEALETRRAVRAFLPDAVDRATVERILALAARAPSGTNLQPWKVWVVAGERLDKLSSRILAAHEADDPAYQDEYPYYPDHWTEPYVSRRRKLGKDLYALLGIGKGDAPAMKRQFGRNYTFFGAPVGLFVTIERSMNVGSWLDLGTFLQSILLAARGFGLHTCPQQAFAKYHQLIRHELNIPETEIIACGIALGFDDPDAPENKLITEREPVSAFATFAWE
ncbi:MAG: nitroreductase [Rhodospirillaceae bacterium]|nr:nitroreductase [Rhodospirillales bacterium]